MSVVVSFPNAARTKGPQRIQATYTVREISRQFGWSEALIRRWAKENIIQAVNPAPDGDLCFDFHALELFRRARELRNRGLSLRRVEAELHGQLNLFPENESVLIPLPVRISPFEEALILHENEDGRAVEMYRRSIDKGECVADAYCNLGVLDYEAGDILGAFDHFTNALKHEPRHVEAHFNLAHLYFEKGDINLSRLHYEISAAIEPGSVAAHFNLGLIHSIESRLPDAVAEFNKAREFATAEELEQIEEILTSMKNTANGDGIHWVR